MSKQPRYLYSCDNPQTLENTRVTSDTSGKQWCCGCSRFVPVELFTGQSERCDGCRARPHKQTKNHIGARNQ